MHRHVYARAVFVLAPLVWLAGWIIMRLGGSKGPGIGWKSAHVVWIVGFGLFALVVLLLWREVTGAGAGRRIAAGAAGTALTGAVLMIGQMVVDLWASFGAADKAEMSARTRDAFEIPGLELALFVLAPVLLYTGLFALLTVLAVQHRVSPWSPALVVLAVVLSMVGRGVDGVRLLEGVGALALLAALLPFAGERQRKEQLSSV
ncbi:hypothetical protein [Actinoplanes solisilvae]|uniref:hypothetical protein n=1 Tax=Actinoplanes solisilvae TaxID=2486853 RepID=UPI000FDA9579|nr:hypothetical protein [Actinoplanes solisilvae]